MYADVDEIPSKLITDEVTTKGDAYPLVLNFQHGYANDSIENAKCLLLQDEKSHRKSVAMDVDGQVYAGEEQEEQLGHTYLIARDRLTGKVRLIEVANASIKPIIASGREFNEEKTTDLELSRRFGSKKSKQIHEQKEKLKVNVETVQKQMKTVIANTSVDQIDLKDYSGASEDNEDFYVPPINREAERVNQVYTMEGIMSNEMYDTIYAEIEHKEYQQELAGTMKVLNKVKSLSPRETVLALYYSGMVKMYSTTVKVFSNSKFTFCESSPTIHKLLMENFTQTVNKKVNRSPAYKDKLLGYGLVIAMLLNNYSVNLDNFAAEFKVAMQTMMTKSKVTGATFERVNGVRMLRLKLPLASRMQIRRGNKSRF